MMTRTMAPCHSRNGVRATLWRILYDLYRLLRLTTSLRRCAATQTEQPHPRPLLPTARYGHRWTCQCRLDTHPEIHCDELQRPPTPTLPRASQVVVPEHSSYRVESSRGIQMTSRDSPPKAHPVGYRSPLCTTRTSEATSILIPTRQRPYSRVGADRLRTSYRCGTDSQQEHLVLASSSSAKVPNTVGRSVCEWQLYIPMHIRFFFKLQRPTEPQHQKQSCSPTPEPEVEPYP